MNQGPQPAPPVEPRPRVLVVEDNYAIGMVMCGHLESLGYEPVGPVASLAEGIRRSRGEPFSGAILDVNIRGGTSELIARELIVRGVPFFFVTGYASPLLISESLRGHLRLSKPLTPDMLREATQRHFRPAG